MKMPADYVDENLRDRPKDPQAWIDFVSSLQKKLKIPADPLAELETLEYLGIGYRILLRLDEAEVTLATAVSMAEAHGTASRQAQNLARLAHVYQWKRDFAKAFGLYDRINEIRRGHPFSEGLAAALHQHLGKLLFDGGHYAAAQAEFLLALAERERLKLADDAIQSSLVAVDEARRRLSVPQSLWIRRAELGDAAKIHNAHMRSIQQVCSRDHSAAEIAGWGSRPFEPENRAQQIIKDWVWVVPFQSSIEGYGHLRIFEKDGQRFGYIFGFYLTPEILGRGVGRALFEIMMEVMRAREVVSVTLLSTITAQEFYRKMGFENNGPEKSVELGGAAVRCYPMKMCISKVDAL